VTDTQNQISARNIGSVIANMRPDVLVVGGWSKGYDEVLDQVGKVKSFPVVSIYHNTLFHGSLFGDEQYKVQINNAYTKKQIDFLGFVQPQAVEYYRKIRRQNAVWVPHYFEPQNQILINKGKEKFRIGILGGVSTWYKNAAGAVQVAADFCKSNPSCEVVMNHTYDRQHSDFIKLLRSCHLLIHTTHLECYPNVVQEAWASGIPVILSGSSIGLTENPLIRDNAMMDFVLKSNISALELYRCIEEKYHNWQACSDFVHRYASKLHKESKSYTHKMMVEFKKLYREGSRDSALFDQPFV